MKSKTIIIPLLIIFAFLLLAPVFVFAAEPIACCVTKDSQQKITRCTAAYSATTDCSFFGGGTLQNQSCGTINECVQLQNATQFCCVGQTNQTVTNCIPAYSAGATCDYGASSGINYTLNNQACGAIDSCKKLLGSTPAQPSAPAPAQKETPFVPLEPKLQIPIPDLTFSKITRQGQLIGIPYLADYIAGIYKYGAGIASFIAIIMIMVGGLRWLTAGGNAGAITSAKEMISGAAIGLFIALGSYLVLYTVNPDLVSFKNLQIKLIQQQPLDELTFEKSNESAGSIPINLSTPELDKLFRGYAACYGLDWRILKSIAAGESGLMSGAGANQKYQGLFQMDLTYCNDGIVLGGYPPSLNLDCDNRLDPETNTAAAAAIINYNFKKIATKCPSVNFYDGLTLSYIGHNNGPGVMNYVMNQGACSGDAIRIKVREFYSSKPGGSFRGVDANWGEKKYKYGLKIANSAKSLGVTELYPKEADSNLCPKTTGQKIIK